MAGSPHARLGHTRYLYARRCIGLDHGRGELSHDYLQQELPMAGFAGLRR